MRMRRCARVGVAVPPVKGNYTTRRASFSSLSLSSSVGPLSPPSTPTSSITPMSTPMSSPYISMAPTPNTSNTALPPHAPINAALQQPPPAQPVAPSVTLQRPPAAHASGAKVLSQSENLTQLESEPDKMGRIMDTIKTKVSTRSRPALLCLGATQFNAFSSYIDSEFV